MQDELTVVRQTCASDGSTSSVPPTWQVAASIIPVVFPLLVVAIGLGLWLVLSHMTDVSPAEHLETWLRIVVPLVVWLLVVWVLARSGAYKSPLALPIGVLLPPVIGLLFLTRLPQLPQLLDATPRSWLIGFMVLRLVGGVFLVAWASGEVAKPWFNLQAGSLDVLIGATALPVAWWVASGSPIALAVGVGWNLIGLLDFGLALGLSRLGARAGGPGYMLSLDTPIVTALKPTIRGIVTFGVPLAIMIHLLSLWQLVAA